MGRIDINGVSYCYRDNNEVYLALEDIDLHVTDGEFICLIGHSGCGKSTLLSLLAGLAMPDAGTVEVDGIRVTGPSASRAIVFQHYSLFPWMKVVKNVAFSIRHAGQKMDRDEACARALEYLKEVGMADAANKCPFQLSGGMQQRVAIARALAPQPRVLLMDEPFGALDAQTRAQMQNYLLEVWHNIDITVIFVTHDLDEAVYLSDRILALKANPGEVNEVIEVPVPRPRAPDMLLSPEFQATRRHIDELINPNRRAQKPDFKIINMVGTRNYL